jgi:hypothetical protein
MQPAGLWACVMLLGVAGCSWSCSSASEGASSAQAPVRPVADEPKMDVRATSKSMRVGNQVGGLAEMPDYDAEALEIRAAVVDRLPDPLPSAETACARMLAAARARYADIDGGKSAAVVMLDATRDAELAACREETTAHVAVCVTLLVEEGRTEYPKLLDQCTRAFPPEG